MRRSQDYQKQCFRIVVRILDAFHFDLTAAHDCKELAEQKIQRSEEFSNNEEQETEKGKQEDSAVNEDNEAEEDLAAVLEEAESSNEGNYERAAVLNLIYYFFDILMASFSVKV